MSLKFVFVLGVLAVSLRNVRALSDEEKTKIRAKFDPFLTECSAELGVTMEKVKEAIESDTLDTFHPCFMGCVFKKETVIDDKGLYTSDKALELIIGHFSEKDDRKKLEETITKCKSINDKEVEGEIGCERGGLLYRCFKPFNDELGLS